MLRATHGDAAMRSVILTLILLMAAGCAQGWTREPYSQHDFRQDRIECDERARVADIVVYNRIFRDCMYAKGYQRVRGFFWQFSD